MKLYFMMILIILIWYCRCWYIFYIFGQSLNHLTFKKSKMHYIYFGFLLVCKLCVGALYVLWIQNHSTNDAIKFLNYHILLDMLLGKTSYMAMAEWQQIPMFLAREHKISAMFACYLFLKQQLKLTSSGHYRNSA